MKRISSLILLLSLTLILSACGSKDPDTLIIGFVPARDSGHIADTAEPLAEKLSKELDINVESQVMTSYNALIEAMGANQVQIGFIPAFGYVLANDQYDVEVILKSMRHGSGTYRSQYVVRADSNIKELADLEGKIWTFADKASTSGYLFPAKQLMDKFGFDTIEELESDFTGELIEAGSHDTAILSVYEGDADVATSFDHILDTLVDEYPDIYEALYIVDYTEDIPNDTISVSKELDKQLVQKIKQAFLSFNDDEKMIEILNKIYNWNAIEEATDEEYDIVRDAYYEFKDDIDL